MPTSDASSSAKPDVRTPNVEGMRNEKRDELDNDAREAPVAPKTSGGSAPDANPLQTPADLREAGMPTEPISTDEPRTGR